MQNLHVTEEPQRGATGTAHRGVHAQIHTQEVHNMMEQSWQVDFIKVQLISPKTGTLHNQYYFPSVFLQKW